MSQKAALLLEKGGQFQVQTIEKHKPAKGEVLVKIHVVATNPMDGKIQQIGYWIQSYPIILGVDISGTIEEVGEGVTQWKKGDKVYGSALKLPMGTRMGGFQEYTIALENEIGHIPNNFSFEEAAAFVSPLLTAASSFFVDYRLPQPSSKRPIITNDSKICFVNSGASACGSAALQLALLCGYRVIASSSPKNFDLVKSLGASDVFDYKDKELVQKVQKTAGKKIDLGYDGFGEPESTATIIEILEGTGTLLTVQPERMANPSTWKQVKVLNAYGTRILTDKETVTWWWKFAKAAAEEGSIKPLKPLLMGNSLEDVNKVVAFHSSGDVSGVKPMIKLI